MPKLTEGELEDVFLELLEEAGIRHLAGDQVITGLENPGAMRPSTRSSSCPSCVTRLHALTQVCLPPPTRRRSEYCWMIACRRRCRKTAASTIFSCVG